jgi:hypothetical protein
MAKKISSSDLFSQEDLFKGVRDSAQSALVMINQLNAAMKTSAEGLKASIKGADLGSASGLKGFNQAASEANQLKEEAIRLEIMQKKLTAEMEAAEKSRIATERERLKLENDLAKAAARAAKTDADKDSAYKALVKSTRDLKNASKELAAQLLILEKSGQSGTDEFKNLSKQYDDVTKSASEADQQLKEIDKSVGDSFRNVGNYEGAVEGMAKGFTSAKAELRALTNEIMNMKKGTPEFEAARKRASELKDEIQDLSQELSAGAGNAFEQVSGNARLFGQRLLDLDLKGAGAALTGMGNAVRNIDFKTLKEEVGGLARGFGDLAFSVISNPYILLGGAVAALGYTFRKELLSPITDIIAANDKLRSSIKFTSEEISAAAGDEVKQIAKLEELKIVLNDTTTSTKNRKEAVKELQKINPTYFKGLDDEKIKYTELNTQIDSYINGLIAQSLAKAASARIEQESAKYLDEEIKRKQDLETTTAKLAIAQAELADKSKAVEESGRNIFGGKSYGAGFERAKTTAAATGYSIQQLELEIKALNDSQFASKAAYEQRVADLVNFKKTQEQIAAGFGVTPPGGGKGKDSDKDKLIDDYNKAQEEISAILEKWDEERIAAEKKLAEDKLEVERDYARALQGEQANEIYELELNKNEELAVWEEGSRERILIEDKYRILEQSVNDKYDAIALANQMESDAKKKALAEKAKDDAKKIEIEKQKELNDAVKAGTDLFVQESERKQAQITKDLDNAKKQYDTLKALADNGNIDAQQSLAEQQRILDEKERQRMAEVKRQERIKLAQSIFSTYSAKLESGDKNALANTIKDATILTQFVQALPAFLKGTEDTGVNGYGVDGKGGFLSVLHPNERVVPKELNSKMSGITNEELAKIAVAYKTNEFMTSIPSFQQADSSELISRIDNLTKVLKDKPETNIALGEIMQGAMEIVQTTKRGNKTVYNRYRVK